MAQRRSLLPLLFNWAVVGALFSIGFIAILSVGAAMILFGAIAAAALAWINRGRGMWAALIGFGLAPAATLFIDIATSRPLCPAQPLSSYTCGYISLSYTSMAIGFVTIALIGVLIPLTPRVMRALRSGNTPHPNDAA